MMLAQCVSSLESGGEGEEEKGEVINSSAGKKACGVAHFLVLI